MARRVAVRPTVTPSRYQRWWLVSYWVAVALSLVFVLLALFGDGVPGVARIAVSLGAVAAVASTLMATSLSRLGVDDVEFDEATSAMRVIVVAWVVLVVVMVTGTVVGTGAGETDVADADATGAVVGVSEGAAGVLFGLAALFVVAGDGYTKYRRLTHDVRRRRAAVTQR